MSGPLLFWGCFWACVLCAIAMAANASPRRGPLLLGLGVVTGVCFLSGLLLMFLTAIALFAIAAIWPRRLARPVALPLACAAVVAAASSSALSTALQRKAELAQWREEYPFRSMADRLQHEENVVQLAAERIAPTLAPDVELRLAAFEQRDNHTMRSSMLQRLHHETRDEFEMLTGFGPIRMLNLRRRHLELPPNSKVPQPSDWDFEPEPDPFFTSLGPSVELTLPPQDALLSLHDSGVPRLLES